MPCFLYAKLTKIEKSKVFNKAKVLHLFTIYSETHSFESCKLLIRITSKLLASSTLCIFFCVSFMSGGTYNTIQSWDKRFQETVSPNIFSNVFLQQNLYLFTVEKIDLVVFSDILAFFFFINKLKSYFEIIYTH